ncbi:MAG: hypothetical protein HYR85_24800 [Planctomycetes bacterium]|nr:hypothetical protein [Planctomycetota bacterium]MBI3846698.1 hypothetical protein [Planctomycetota bacterium]
MTLFVVRTSPRYERLARALVKAHPEFAALQANARLILGTDPVNRSGVHHVKKLTNVPRGEGQWRLALGRFRFRYDIYGRDVVVSYCGLRREDTYR